MAAEKDAITCHVLNTISGTPAAGISCFLTPIASGPHDNEQRVSYEATTNSDGRVTNWKSIKSGGERRGLAQFLEEHYKEGEKSAWSIRFQVGEWYEQQGVESFWPEVEVKFFVKKGERHYHVPVLVGPWSYTTYRGS